MASEVYCVKEHLLGCTRCEFRFEQMRWPGLISVALADQREKCALQGQIMATLYTARILGSWIEAMTI
jgi:hypothetical protein